MGATLRVPFGMRDGTLYEPLQVPNGKACGCVCPACQRLLIARQKHATPHFAHAPGEDCAKALETAVHLAAKQLIAERREIRLPALTYFNQWLSPPRPQTLAVEQIVPVDAVAVEPWLDGFRPDLTVTIGTATYLVEIAVTHFVDEAKYTKIRERKIPAFEIDASSLKTNFTFAALADLLFTTTYPATWLYHPHQETAVLAAQNQYQEEVAAAEAAKTKARQEREDRFQRYRNLSPKQKLARNLKKIGLREEMLQHLTAFVPWDNSFGVPRAVWQSAVLVYIAKEEEEQGWGDYLPCHIYIEDCLAWLQQVFTVKPPNENGDSIALWKYFKHLEALGMLRYQVHKQFDLLLRRMQWDWLAAQVRNKAISVKKG